MKRQTFNELWMDLALKLAKRSTCSRLGVGCVIVDSTNTQIAVGYNGGPKKQKNGCKYPNKPGQCGCACAEGNCIVNLVKRPITGRLTVYVSHLPCLKCSSMLVNLGVYKVYYKHDFRIKDSLKVFKKAKIKVVKI